MTLIIRLHEEGHWSPLLYRFPSGWQLNLGRIEIRFMKTWKYRGATHG